MMMMMMIYIYTFDNEAMWMNTQNKIDHLLVAPFRSSNMINADFQFRYAPCSKTHEPIFSYVPFEPEQQ